MKTHLSFSVQPFKISFIKKSMLKILDGILLQIMFLPVRNKCNTNTYCPSIVFLIRCMCLHNEE